jgi:hypothetical protein
MQILLNFDNHPKEFEKLKLEEIKYKFKILY